MLDAKHKGTKLIPSYFVGNRNAICAKAFMLDLADPDRKHISTSYVERANLSMRMGMRRFTRLTNAFSKKAENHVHALSLYFMHYNFARIHTTLRVTPAMAAGVTGKLWEMTDIVAMIDAWEAGDDLPPPTTKEAIDGLRESGDHLPNNLRRMSSSQRTRKTRD